MVHKLISKVTSLKLYKVEFLFIGISQEKRIYCLKCANKAYFSGWACICAAHRKRFCACVHFNVNGSIIAEITRLNLQ